ncbi:MAG TPA: choice-of-anchor D domain-containing protein, partial [Myxococcota bacterium]
MRARVLLLPTLIAALGVDGLVGCTCDEVLGQTPRPAAVLVFADQLAPPAANLEIGLAPSLVGTATNARFTIENRGNLALNVSDIVLTSDPTLCPSPSAGFVVASPTTAIVENGSNTAVDITFTASSGQPACTVVEVHSDDPVNPILKAKIGGQGDAPQLCTDRGIVDFGVVFVGERKEETVTLSSCGTRAFNLEGATLNTMFPEPFELVTTITAQTLDVGSDLVVTVAFDPEAPGSFTGSNAGTIDIDTDLEGAFRLQLVGIAQLPPACRIQVVPDLLQFGSVGEGRTSTQSVFVRNIGELDCTFTSADIVTGGSYSRELVSLTAGQTLAPQQTGEVRVTFAPTSIAGRETDILRVTSSDPVNAVIEVPLDATSVEVQPCFLEAVPTAVNFGFQTLRRSTETEVILRNVGTETCIVTTADITLGGPEFSIIEPPFTAIADDLPVIIGNLFPFGAIVPEGDEISFIVGFRPEQAGLRNGNYRFAYKEMGIGNPAQTIDVPANGTGVAPCLEVVPGDVDFGAVAVGAGTNRDVSIRNCGGADLAIRGVGLRSGSHPDFSVPTTPALPASLPPGASVAATVRAA